MTFLTSYQFSEDFIAKLNVDKQTILKEHNRLISDLNQINAQIRMKGYDDQLITAYRQALGILHQYINSNSNFLNCALLSEQNYKNQLLERSKLIGQIEELGSQKEVNQSILKRHFIPKTFFRFYAKLVSEYWDNIINHQSGLDEAYYGYRKSEDLKTHFNKIANCFSFLVLMMPVIALATVILGSIFPPLGFILPPVIGSVLVILVFVAVALSINKHMKLTNAKKLSQHQQACESAKTEILDLGHKISQKNDKKQEIEQEADRLLIEVNELPVEQQEAPEKICDTVTKPSCKSSVENSMLIDGLLAEGVFATSATSVMVSDASRSLELN